MIKVSDIVTASSDTLSWAESPGVLSGCEVFITDGLHLGVKPGKLVTLNGTSVEIKGIIDDIGSISPTLSANRMDYVTAEVYKNSAYFRIIRGEEGTDPIEHVPVHLRHGILLAKVYVTHPTISNSSIYVYNSLPSNGEDFSRAYRPLTVPNGTRTKFYFPLAFNSGYSLDAYVNGVGGQHEGVDYFVTSETSPNGGDLTAIEFNEAPPSRSTIVCNIYLGKIKLV